MKIATACSLSAARAVFGQMSCLFIRRISSSGSTKKSARTVIKDIMFSAKGYRKATEQQQKERFGTKVKNLESVKIDEAEEQAALKVASNIPSTELAAKIQKAVLSSKRLTKVKIEEGWHQYPNVQPCTTARMIFAEIAGEKGLGYNPLSWGRGPG